MKTLKPGSKIINTIVVTTVVCIICGMAYGIALAGQQSPNQPTLLVALNGTFWGFFMSVTFFGIIFYPTVSFAAHLIWCLFTHDRKYHWSIRMVTGLRVQFKELRPKYYSWI